MVFVVTQESYDSAVKENMEVFEMGLEEAIKETMDQFKAQGVDLSHIITDWMLAGPAGSPAVKDAIVKLDDLNKADGKEPQEYVNELEIIRKECERGLQYKVLAGKEGAYHVILATMQKLEADKGVVQQCLKTLISLMTKQPDLLEERGIQTIIKYIDQETDFEVLQLLLKWIKECCIMHEQNRQHIFDANILEHLKRHLIQVANSALLRDILGVLRALVLDDDVRVDFGRSHDHARTIASDTLCVITSLLDKFKKDEALISDVMLTLSALLVRNEFCEKLEDAGGLQIIKDAMVDFHNSDKLIRQCLKLLKGLAGNDRCKAHIIEKGTAPIIVSAISAHLKSEQTATYGLGSVAAITLRSPENSKVLFDAGIVEVIVEAMQLHPENENVQKNGCWAIRNMVSRSRYQCKKFIELGIEAILHNDLTKFKNSEYDIKAALRDLGCKVDLKEEWTGKGGRITTQAKK